jgi:atypical dual specificity phosphatase
MRDRIFARVVFLPTLLWTVLLGRVLGVRRWWDRVDENVILGALPFFWDVAAMKKEGVTAVVNLCDEYAGPRRAYRRAGIEQLRIPTVDFTHPALHDVARAVSFVSQHVDRGGSVYVHCRAGRARSATVVLCWLIEAKRLSPEEGQARLLEKRAHVDRKLADRPVVQEFHRLGRGDS